LPVPGFPGGVLTAAIESLAVRGKFKGQNFALMTADASDTLPGLPVPESDIAVVAAGSQQLTVGMPRDRTQNGGMLQGMQARDCISNLPDAGGIVVAPAGERLPVGAPVEAPDPVGVACQQVGTFPGLGIPEPNGEVARRTGEPASGGVPAHR